LPMMIAASRRVVVLFIAVFSLLGAPYFLARYAAPLRSSAQDQPRPYGRLRAPPGSGHGFQRRCAGHQGHQASTISRGDSLLVWLETPPRRRGVRRFVTWSPR